MDSYNKAMAASPSQHTLPKGLFMFSLGTAIFATVMYKITKSTRTGTQTPTPTPTRWTNFLSRFFNHFIINQEENTDIPPFEDKYFKEYDEWTAATATATATATTDDNTSSTSTSTSTGTETDTHDHKNKSVRETINDFYGDIIMYYDAATSSFIYYARTANIPYKYLETVSRKYMIETNAPRDIHVDIRKEYAKAKDKLTKKSTTTATTIGGDKPETETETDSKNKEDNVFAKFKSYNMTSNLSTQQQQQQQQQQQPQSHQATNTSNTNVLRENANRYSYRGKIEDYSIICNNNVTNVRPTNTPHTPPPPTNETYAEYKKRTTMKRSAL
jgi:hypothetical protein